MMSTGTRDGGGGDGDDSKHDSNGAVVTATPTTTTMTPATSANAMAASTNVMTTPATTVNDDHHQGPDHEIPQQPQHPQQQQQIHGESNHFETVQAERQQQQENEEEEEEEDEENMEEGAQHQEQKRIRGYNMVLSHFLTHCQSHFLNVGTSSTSQNIKIVSYNVEGPDISIFNAFERYSSFRDDYLQGDEDIICIQEAKQTGILESVFSDYPYTYITKYSTTHNDWDFSCFCHRATDQYMVILSKYPFLSTHNQLIQKDSHGDGWQRKVQYVRVDIGNDLDPIHVYNFHNSNVPEGASTDQAESGLLKFKMYVWMTQFKILNQDLTNDVFMVGDFNLNSYSTVMNILGTNLIKHHSGVDYIVSNLNHDDNKGYYDTSNAPNIISDHPAIWASYVVD